MADTEYTFGWQRDKPDWRDLKLAPAPDTFLATMPRYVNLITTKRLPGIWSQGNLGTCTAHAGPAAWCYDRAKQGLPFIMPSRLFVYWNERAYEGSTDYDSGASIRDCFRAMVAQGACDEKLWPYNTSQYKTKPPPLAYTNATEHVGVEYSQVTQTLNQLKACIVQGYPFVFGFTVYESFITNQVARTGLVPYPGMNERSVGGHAVCAVGYNSRNYFLIRNSWGTSWGDPDFPGHCWMPGAYLTNTDLSADFWTLRSVSG